jgi:4-hydroxy-2-oxoheptanedioate aldolase
VKNVAKLKLQSGETIVGAFVGFPHPDVCEWLAHLGFDWLILDMEHGPLSFEMVQRWVIEISGPSRRRGPFARHE